MSAPTLIVGLGGTGSKIVLRVAEKVSEEQRKSIGFAVFDTDVNELRQISENNPFVHTIQTSTKLSVGEYLDIDVHSRDTWFPVNAILNSKTLTEGAGQVRAISRLALETAIRAGKMESLHQAIENLYKLEGNEYEQALRVIIVSSLAGGTGSGLILPVALYIKNYLATRFRQSANITRGFFLLPEVFYEVIKGQAERNNLKSNAYATLRELDAFLMKGDSTLHEKYKDSVKIDFPCAGTGEYEQYNVRPYDYCFLFDAQNADGKKLDSFNQYLDHAANCIYAQSIGPMNKRSNSSEDNTIRKLCSEKGRNRYAGAGTSMLIYPNEDVKEYLALTWASECVSDQWLVFDKMFKERKEEIARMRRQGLKVVDVNAAKCYVETVEQMAKDKDPFAAAIVNACGRYDESGFTKISNKWDDYMDALMNKIEMENSSGQEELDSARTKVSVAMNELTPDNNSGVLKTGDDTWEAYINTYLALQKYKGMIMKYADESSHTIAYTIFKASAESAVSDKQKFRLETYLRDADNSFIHPSAVRYFLYKVLDGMKKRRISIQDECEEIEKFFDGFEAAYFDDPKTDDVEETVNDLARTKKVSLKDRIRKRLSSDQEDLKAAYSTYLQKADDYRVQSVLLAVFEEGIDYVQSLCDAFQKFFMSFDEKIATIEKKRSVIEKKYNSMKGTAARYVCASSVCLHAMSDEMPYTGSYITIDNELAEDIYVRVRSYAMLPKKTERLNSKSRRARKSEEQNEYSGYFSDIFEYGILNYFADAVEETYGDIVNMDVITAIEKEASYEHGIYDPAKVEQYVKHVFDETKILAAPFIEKPLGEEKDPINSCAYNVNLNPHDDSPRSKLIDKELRNFGGEEDKDVPMNMILFYKSFYGLRANDLSKFAPPQKTDTYNRSAGEYYKAYFELIANIHPEPHKSKVITPHIDRWWHNVVMLPDLDEENQARQEEEIYSAFFWGIVGRYIDMFETGYDQRMYRLLVEKLGMENEESRLIVSNSTPCDQLYEVLDSLAIYPELVRNIILNKEKIISEEIDNNVPIEEGFLMNCLKNFRVKEFAFSEDDGVRSIFDLPLLLKKSVTKEQYFEEKVVRILKTEIAEIENYVTRFCGAKELPRKMKEILMGQFEKFLRDIEVEQETWSDIYHDYLFTRTCDIIAKELENLQLKDEAKYINNKKLELSR